jgi:very-short-patch-repair endonuclease
MTAEGQPGGCRGFQAAGTDTPTALTQQSSSAEKIALFRSLFRGREDVYPRRFESRKTGRAGYQPACGNEWIRGVCEKPRVKCSDCPNQRFLPVTDEVVRWHLSGRDGAGHDFVMGVYPMLRDETCYFLAVDFDRDSWHADAAAFVETCRNLAVPVALERSRSGNGGHVWFFFDEAVPAITARKLGSLLLTETMERWPELGLRSYDRLFPNQDTLPKGGFGNLIALPLQRQARDRDNSVFVDGDFQPHPDQWALLASIQRVVLVHRQQLLEQWVERLATFLELSSKAIGRLGGGRKKLTGALDVALMQSLVRKGVVDDRVANYGHLVVDECHHVSAHSFEQVARRTKARFITGLSATVTRKDGHHPIIFMQCGPVRFRVDARQQAAARPFTHEVIVRPTGFRSPFAPEEDPRIEFQKLQDALSKCDNRNRLICADVLEALRGGRTPLVLTERTEHLSELAERLREHVPQVVTLQGGMGKKALRQALTCLSDPAGPTGRVLLATGKYIGEGFDDPRLDTLFLALPVSWRGTITQYVGRLHRLHEGKREVRVYDYADLEVPMLARMFDRRCRGYEAAGYTILLPASALPGWPSDVPLPVDPEWKRDYSASVRRLIRDGVDTPLANLFVHAAHRPSPDSEGADRARSASEAFLLRRLETLSDTAGRFQLNVRLPIPFDSAGSMEVDFLCADVGVVIELDGAQHLADPAAYRRDRQKDALLQEQGFFVLRFLAEDLAKELDLILDTILRTLAHRARHRRVHLHQADSAPAETQ